MKKYRFIYKENEVENYVDFEAKSPAHAKSYVVRKWPHVVKILLVEFRTFDFINYETGESNCE